MFPCPDSYSLLVLHAAKIVSGSHHIKTIWDGFVFLLNIMVSLTVVCFYVSLNCQALPGFSVISKL